MKATTISKLPPSIPACCTSSPSSSPLEWSIHLLYTSLLPSLSLILCPDVQILLLQRELLSSALLCSPVPSPPSLLLFPLSLLPLLVQSALSCLFPALNRLHYTLLLSISSKRSSSSRLASPPRTSKNTSASRSSCSNKTPHFRRIRDSAK